MLISELLHDTQQIVNIGFSISNIVNVFRGIIQGNVFGPLLFVVLPDIIIHFAVAMVYANGLKLHDLKLLNVLVIGWTCKLTLTQFVDDLKNSCSTTHYGKLFY